MERLHWPAGVPSEQEGVGTRRAHEVLEWTHRVFYSLKRWAMGVYHGLRRKRFQGYLDGSVLRWNCRSHRRASLDRLPGLGLGLPPATCRDSADGHA